MAAVPHVERMRARRWPPEAEAGAPKRPTASGALNKAAGKLLFADERKRRLNGCFRRTEGTKVAVVAIVLVADYGEVVVGYAGDLRAPAVYRLCCTVVRPVHD